MEPSHDEEAQSSEEEMNFEELDILCDGVEADKMAEQQKEFVKQMHSKMDEKLEMIKQSKLL